MKELNLLAAQTSSFENKTVSEEIILSSIQLMDVYEKQHDHYKTIEYGEKALKAIQMLYNANNHPSYTRINLALIRSYSKINRFFKSKEIADSLKPYQTQHQDMEVLFVINEATRKFDQLKADANNEDAEAQHILAANFALYGNEEEALKWYQKSADGGYIPSKYILLHAALHNNNDAQVIALYKDIKKSPLHEENVFIEVGNYFSQKALDATNMHQFTKALEFFDLASECGLYKASYSAGMLAHKLNKPIEAVRQYFYAGLNNGIKSSHDTAPNDSIAIRAQIHNCLAYLDLIDHNSSENKVTRAIYNLAISNALGNNEAGNKLNLLANTNPHLINKFFSLTTMSSFPNGLVIPWNLVLQCKLSNLAEEEFTHGFHAFLSGVPGIFDAPESRINLETHIINLIQRAFSTFQERSPTVQQPRVTRSWDAPHRVSASTTNPMSDAENDVFLNTRNKFN